MYGISYINKNDNRSLLLDYSRNEFPMLKDFTVEGFYEIYYYILLEGSLNDDLNLLSSSIFILGLAGLEYSVGILILVLFKNLNNTLELVNLNKNNKKNNILNINNFYINRYI